MHNTKHRLRVSAAFSFIVVMYGLGHAIWGDYATEIRMERQNNDLKQAPLIP